MMSLSDLVLIWLLTTHQIACYLRILRKVSVESRGSLVPSDQWFSVCQELSVQSLIHRWRMDDGRARLSGLFQESFENPTCLYCKFTRRFTRHSHCTTNRLRPNSLSVWIGIGRLTDWAGLTDWLLEWMNEYASVTDRLFDCLTDLASELNVCVAD